MCLDHNATHLYRAGKVPVTGDYDQLMSRIEEEGEERRRKQERLHQMELQVESVNKSAGSKTCYSSHKIAFL
jgi:ferritin-like metal-binding protein YciE